MTRDQFLRLVETYCAAVALSEATVSTRIFDHGSRIAQIRAGASPRLSSMESALEWFSGHWPDDLPWPADVPRPAPRRSIASPVIAAGGEGASAVAVDHVEVSHG